MRSPLVIIMLAAALGSAEARPDAAPLSPAAKAVTVKGCRGHVAFLAADELKGRNTPSEGLKVAGRYISTRFEEAGLKPAGPAGSWFQPFDLAQREPRAEAGLRYMGVNTSLASERAVPFFFSSEGECEAALVFVGYGITSKDYDDYAGLDVKGKIVLLLRYAPGRGDKSSYFNSREGRRHQTFVAKLRNALKHGAAGFLLVQGPAHGQESFVGQIPVIGGLADEPAPEHPGSERRRRIQRIPALQISRAVAAGLLASSTQRLATLQAKIESSGKPASFALPGRASLRVTMQIGRVPTRNVLGMIEGSDPKLRHEFVVLGAHYDHVGVSGAGEDRIHNGADDNASGTSGLISVAQAIANTGLRPRRSILFMAFAGEERGLLGSRHWVRKPTVPLGQVVAMINLDMIGRNNKGRVQVQGAYQSPVLAKILKRANAAVGYKLELAKKVEENSDHFSFYRKGIPVLFLTTGLHRDYHRVSDELERIDALKIRDVSRIALGSILLIANRNERPRLAKKTKLY